MTASEETVGRHGSRLLAGIMVAILLASAAVAFLLARRRRAAAIAMLEQMRLRRAAAVEVLGEIRLRKLPAFWGPQPVADWYLRRGPDGKAVGWSTEQREPTDDGYRGRRIARVGATLYRETWAIDAAARTGRYSADTSALIRSPGRPVPVPRRVRSTSIDLGDGRVEVRQEQPGSAEAASAPAPENYIPEGLLKLAFHRTAARGRKVSFVTIVNLQAVVGGQVRFLPIHVVPQGRSGVRVRYGQRDREAEDLLEFDEDGRLLREQNLEMGTSLERSDFETVRRAFPEADLFAADRRKGPPAGANGAEEL
jgi:hypothetical protein